MIKFRAKIFEEIFVEGKIALKAERKFKIFKNFELNIFREEEQIISISSITKFLDTKFIINKNRTGFDIEILDQSSIIFDGEYYTLKIDRLYPFKKRYGDLFINKEKVGEILFEKRLPIKSTLNFIPTISEETVPDANYIKIAILILLNIVDLDGSE